MIYNLNEFWNYDGSNNGKFLMQCIRLNEKIQQQKRKALSPYGAKIAITFLEDYEMLDIRCDDKEVFPIDNEEYNFFSYINDFMLNSNNYQDVMEKKKNELLTAIHNSNTLIKKDLEEMKKYITSIKTIKLSQNQRKQLEKLILDYRNHAEYLKKLDDAIFYAKNKILDNYNNAIIKHNKIYKEKNITLKNSVKKSVFNNKVQQNHYNGYNVLKFQYNNEYNNYNNNFINRNQKNKLKRLNPYDQNLNNINNMENPFNSKNPYLPEIKQVNNKKVILPTLKNVFRGKQIKGI